MNIIKVNISHNFDPEIILNEDDEKFILKIGDNLIMYHKLCSITKGEGDNFVNLCVKYDDDVYLYNLNLSGYACNFIKKLIKKLIV